MYMPEIDPLEHLKIKEKLMMSGLERLDQFIDAEMDKHATAKIQPISRIEDKKCCNPKTMKNRQKRLRKINKKK